MNKAISVTLTYTLGFSLVALFVLFFFADPVVQLFIKDLAMIHYVQSFLKIICFMCPSMAINFMIIAVFQATDLLTK